MSFTATYVRVALFKESGVMVEGRMVGRLLLGEAADLAGESALVQDSLNTSKRCRAGTTWLRFVLWHGRHGVA